MQPGSNWAEPVAAPSAESERPGYRAPIYGPASYEPPPHEPPEEPRARSRIRRALGPIGAAIVAFFAKFKAILLLLPKIKLLASTGTMFVSIAAYTVLWGWQFAVGFVALLLVHEMGHVIQLRREDSRPACRCSSRSSARHLRALARRRRLGRSPRRPRRADPRQHRRGGVHRDLARDRQRPLPCPGLHRVFLNLFNLLPVVPLDGGRAMAAMAPWMWFVGFAALIPLLFVFFNPIFLIIILFAGRETWTRWQRRRRGGEAEQAYYKVRPMDRALVAAVYIALIAMLVAGMHATYFTRTLN